MTTKHDSSKSETSNATGTGAGTGTSTGTGAGTAAGMFGPGMFGPGMFGPGMFGADAFARGQEMFARLMQEQLERSQRLVDELAAYEAVAVQRARTAVADLAKLVTDSLDYGAKLSAEWRKLAADSGRRAAEQVSPRA